MKLGVYELGMKVFMELSLQKTYSKSVPIAEFYECNYGPSIFMQVECFLTA